MQVVLPDQLLESVFSGYYEIYLYEFGSREESASLNRCLYNLGTRAVLLRMLQEQQMFDVRMVSAAVGVAGGRGTGGWRPGGGWVNTAPAAPTWPTLCALLTNYHLRAQL